MFPSSRRFARKRRKATAASLICVVGLLASSAFAGQDPAAGEAQDVPAEAEDSEADEPRSPDEVLVVTASRYEERVRDTPVSVTALGETRIATTPAENHADLLRGVPGVNVLQMSARDLNFTNRGATGVLANSQLTLVDGRSVYQDLFGFILWDLLTVPLDELEQVEILRGPGSAVWGANAQSGAINLRTKSPRDALGGSFSLSAGEVGTRGASVRWAAAGEKLAYKISAGYFEQDAWERDEPLSPSVSFPNEGTKQPKLNVRVDYDQDNGGSWILEAGHARTSGIFWTGTGPFSLDDSTSMTFASAGYERGSVEADFYVNHLSGETTNLLGGSLENFDTTTVYAGANDRRVVGSRHVLVYGGNVRSSLFDLTFAPDDDSRNEAGVFLEDRWLVSKRVRLQLGVRTDWFDTIGVVVSPRTGVIYSPHPDHTVRLAYNRGYRAPSIVENYNQTQILNAVELIPGTEPFVFPTAVLGNEDLSEESTDAFELSYVVKAGKRATFSVAVYHNRTEDLIQIQPVEFYSPGDPPPGWPLPPDAVPPFTLPKTFSFVNIGEVVDEGVEVAANLVLNRWLGAALTYTWQDEPEIDQGSSPVAPVLNTAPSDQWSATVFGTHGRWSGSLGLTYTGSAFWRDVLDERFWGPTDSYSLLNAALTVRLGGRVDLSLRGTNLLNERAKQHVLGDVIRRRVVAELRVAF